MRVLVTGASGLLGINYCLHFEDKQNITGIFHLQELFSDRIFYKHVDLSVEKNVKKLIEDQKPDVIFNFAAFANLEKCNNDPELAHILNADLPGWLSLESSKHSIKLIHVSTDAVFDGTKHGAYKETDAPNPQSVYAKTKYEGEGFVLQGCNDAIVARVNFYGFSISGSRSLAELFLSSYLNNKEMVGFTDVIFSPLYVVDLSELLWKMVEKSLSGLFHVESSNSLSKYEFGVEIGKKLNADLNLIKPISVDDAKFLKAKRSKNLVLDTAKIQKSLQEEIPNYQVSLERFIDDFQAGYEEKIEALKG